MNVTQALTNRISANQFDADATISEQDIREMVALAAHSPTSFNCQNWHVIAVTDPAVRKEVRAAAWDQPKVTDSAVLFAILGNTQVVEKLDQSMKLAVDASVVAPEIKDWFVSNAGPFYEGNPELMRDEALRSASYLAMSMMLVAQEKGYGSGPMIGFDPQKVASILNVPSNYVVTLLLSVGPTVEGNWTRKPRRKDILSFDTFS